MLYRRDRRSSCRLEAELRDGENLWNSRSLRAVFSRKSGDGPGPKTAPHLMPIPSAQNLVSLCLWNNLDFYTKRV
jgi:hypothetical protein